MRFEEKEVRLRDGRACILKPTEPAYAAEMIDFMRETAAETPFLLRYPDEIQYTREGETALLNEKLEDPRTIMLMALVEGDVAGNSAVNPLGTARRVQHRGAFAIALKQRYWGLGIGTAMIEAISHLALCAGYAQLELGVIEGNERARRLYERCGFIETGRQIDAVRYDDGTYRDEILMTKKLNGR